MSAEGDATEWVTAEQVMAAHAEHGRLDRDLVRRAMGPNWPASWDRLGPGEGIFEPKEKQP